MTILCKSNVVIHLRPEITADQFVDAVMPLIQGFDLPEELRQAAQCQLRHQGYGDVHAPTDFFMDPETRTAGWTLLRRINDDFPQLMQVVGSHLAFLTQDALALSWTDMSSCKVTTLDIAPRWHVVMEEEELESAEGPTP